MESYQGELKEENMKETMQYIRDSDKPITDFFIRPDYGHFAIYEYLDENRAEVLITGLSHGECANILDIAALGREQLLRDQEVNQMAENTIESTIAEKDAEQTQPLPELKKVYITLHKSYCYQIDDKFREGQKFNRMTMPKGTTLDGRDIGGAKITPKFMDESKYNRNEMVATYYMSPEADGMDIKLSMPDGTFERVDVESLKEAVDAQKQLYREQQKEQAKEKEQQKDQTKETSKSRERDRGEEME